MPLQVQDDRPLIELSIKTKINILQGIIIQNHNSESLLCTIHNAHNTIEITRKMIHNQGKNRKSIESNIERTQLLELAAKSLK